MSAKLRLLFNNIYVKQHGFFSEFSPKIYTLSKAEV